MSDRAGEPADGPAPGTAPLLRAAAHLFALMALAALIASLTIFKMSNNDIWIHMKTGAIVLDTWRFPGKDPYSFTLSDHDYVTYEWLSGVVFHLVYAASGVNGLIFFKALVVLGACAALYRTCRVLRVRSWIIYPVFTLMLFTASVRFVERPHIFSYLFFALYLLCYFSYREGGRRRAWLAVVPVLHVLWANMHGGHLQGLFLLAALAIAELVMLLRARLGLARDAALPARDVALVCALPVLCLLASLVNPHGHRFVVDPFQVLVVTATMRTVYEWIPPLHPAYNGLSMFLYYIVWTALLSGTFLAVRGHGELAGWKRNASRAANVVLAGLWILFCIELAAVYRSPPAEAPVGLERHAVLWYAAVALFLAANAHRLEFHHAGIAALFFAMSLRYNRAVADFVVATLPALAHNLEEIAGRLAARAAPRSRPWHEPVLNAAMGAAMLGLAVFTFRESYYFRFDPPLQREAGLGVASNMPNGAVDYIESRRITGRALASYAGAAMLIHRMWPEVKVAMDSRAGPEGIYLDYLQAMRGGRALEEYLRVWQVDFLLISLRSDAAAARHLHASPEWCGVYTDDRWRVYVKKTARFSAIIARDGCESRHPG